MRCCPINQLAALGVLAALASGPARAQQDGPSDPGGDSSDPPSPTAGDEELVVTGQRSPEQAFASARSVALVTGQQLGELAPRTTPEALLDTPGVFVQQTNHAGGSPILRGMIGPQVQIRFDGVRLNNSTWRTGPVQYLNLIEPLLVDHIEVLRGPASVLYGSDAMGGVIQVFPQAPQDYRGQDTPSAHGGMTLRYAHANRGKTASGHFEGGLKGFGLGGAVTYKVLGDLHGGGQTDLQPYSGYTQPSALVIGEQRLSKGPLEGWAVRAGLLYSQIDDAGRTDKLYDAGSLQLYDNTELLGWAALHMDEPGQGLEGDLTLSYQSFFEREDNLNVDQQLEPTMGGSRDEVEVGTLGLDLQLSKRLLGDRLRVLAGGEHYRDRVGARAFGRESSELAWSTADTLSYPDGSSYRQSGAFLTGHAQLLPSAGEHQIEASAGLRYHGVSADAPAQADLPTVSFGAAGAVGHASLRHGYADRVSTALSFSQGYRAPNLAEAAMLGDTGEYFHIPNAGLTPERADTLELINRASLGRIDTQLAAYHTWLQDPIKRQETTWLGEAAIDGKPVVHNVNADAGRIIGAEAGAGVDLGRGLSSSAHATWTWGEELVEGDDPVPLSRIPPLFGTWNLRYDATDKKLRAFVEAWVRAASSQARLSPEDESDSRIPDGGTPGWWTLNFRVGMGVYKQTRLTLGVENLLNAEYRYHGSGIVAAGININAALEARF